MNIEHLRLFVRVASTLNISKAGQDLGLSAPLASIQLNKLEESLGTRLVNRTTRKISLTEEGAAFLLHAEEVIASVEAAHASLKTGSAQPKGTLRITAPASFGRMYLIPGMKGFLEQYPDLFVDIQLTDSIIDLVEGGFDIALRNAELQDSSLIARKLAEDKRIICASPDYILKHGKPNSPEDLSEHQCISQVGMENWVFNTPQGAVSIKPRGNVRLDHGEAVRDICVSGVGIAMCATWIAHEHLKQGSLVQMLEDYPLTDDTAIWAIYPSSRLLAPKVRVFIDYFSEYYKGSTYWDAAL